MLQWPAWIAGITSEEIHLKSREDQRGQQKATVFKPYEQSSNPMIKAVFRPYWYCLNMFKPIPDFDRLSSVQTLCHSMVAEGFPDDPQSTCCPKECKDQAICCVHWNSISACHEPTIICFNIVITTISYTHMIHDVPIIHYTVTK